MDLVFKKIIPQKVTEEIAEQIRSLIKEGKLQPGEKLPPERTFANILGVGRSSLREAMNILEAQGFVEPRKRKGIYVRSLGAPVMSDPLRWVLEEDKTKLIQLYEIRKDLELASASKSAQLRSDDDLMRMRTALQKMEKDSNGSTFSLDGDLEFHLAIARSTNNFFRSHILKSLFDLSDEYLKFVVRIMTEEKRRIKQVLEQHQDIYEAIEEKDPERAKAMMEKHLTWVEIRWKKFVGIQS